MSPSYYHTDDLMETRGRGTHDESCTLCPKSTSCHEAIVVITRRVCCFNEWFR